MVFLTVISMLVGFLGSLTGLGGASILIPVLVLLGIPLKEAIACGMVAIIATSSGSAASYVKERITNVKVAMYLEMFTITGAIIGATITTHIRPVFLYFFFAAFLSTSFLRLQAFDAHKEHEEEEDDPEDRAGDEVAVNSPDAEDEEDEEHRPRPDRLADWLNLSGGYYDQNAGKVIEYKARNALLGGLGMLIAGLAAGMLGIGAGAFKVTVQENILRLPPKVSSSTSNFIIGMTALAGVSVYLFSGLLNLTLMAPMAIGTTVGAAAGSRFLNRMSDKTLRLLFFVIVIYLIVQMLYKGATAIL